MISRRGILAMAAAAPFVGGAAARAAIEEKYLAAPNVIGVIVAR